MELALDGSAGRHCPVDRHCSSTRHCVDRASSSSSEPFLGHLEPHEEEKDEDEAPPEPGQHNQSWQRPDASTVTTAVQATGAQAQVTGAQAQESVPLLGDSVIGDLPSTARDHGIRVNAVSPPAVVIAIGMRDMAQVRGETDDELSPRHDSLVRRALLCVLDAEVPEQLERLRSRRSRRLLDHVTRYVFASICFVSLSVLMSIWLLAHGFIALARSTSSPCQGPMRNWLLDYVYLHILGPLLIPLAILLRSISPQLARVLLSVVWPLATSFLLAWCSWAVLFLRTPPRCAALQGLLSEFLALEVIALLALATVGLYSLAAQPLIYRLNSILAREECEAAETRDSVVAVPSIAAPSKDECVICLGCLEERSGEDERDYDDLEVGDTTPMASRPRSRSVELCCGSTRAGQQMVSFSRRSSTDGEDAQEDQMLCKVRPPWRRLKCGHQFHEQCLFEWLRKARRCPMCRAHVRKDSKTKSSRNRAASTRTDAGSRSSALPRGSASAGVPRTGSFTLEVVAAAHDLEAASREYSAT